MQHPRHVFYKGLMESHRELDPEFDEAVIISPYTHTPDSLTSRVTILFTLQTQLKTPKESTRAKTSLEGSHKIVLKQCLEEHPVNVANLQDVWLSAWNMLRLHMRSLQRLQYEQTLTSSPRWQTL
jgi:hypothetical protein